MQANSLDEAVRERLRHFRTERGLTLETVARRAGMDVSTLSRLESGKRRLALDHVPQLATALGVTTDDLLRPPTPVDPRIRATPQTKDGLTQWPLTRSGPAGGLHAFKIRIHPERRTPPSELPVHDGQDWFYVMSGRMRLILGTEDLTVSPGEAVEFSTTLPHWFGVVDEAVELIAIFGPHGEQIHLRQEP